VTIGWIQIACVTLFLCPLYPLSENGRNLVYATLNKFLDNDLAEKRFLLELRRVVKNWGRIAAKTSLCLRKKARSNQEKAD
jgi:hypothetical protein